MEDFAFDIFDALDNIEDFDCDEDSERVAAGIYDIQADAAFSETDFLEGCDCFLPDAECFCV